MLISDLTGCCCAGVVFKLDNEWYNQRSSLSEIDPNENEETISNSLQHSIENAKVRPWKILLATTNSHQKIPEEVLLKFNFQKVVTFFNSIHQVDVTLWYLLL